MSKLDTFTESTKPEKENRRNTLEDNLKQQEYDGDIEELFDPVIKFYCWSVPDP